LNRNDYLSVFRSAGALDLKSGRFFLSIRFITVELPPFYSANQLTHIKTQLSQIERTTGRRITANAVTISYIQRVFVKTGCSLLIHFAVRQVYSSWNTLAFKGKSFAGVDGYNFFAGLKCRKQIGRIHFKG
jgi:hypothetical protein